MFSRKKTPIGLDIGSSCIKAVVLNDTKDGYELAYAGVAPLPQEVIVDEVVADKQQLTAVLRELIGKTGIKPSEAIISASGHSSVIIKRITIPLMTEEELGVSIKFEAEQYIPFDINDVNIDFRILGPNPDAEGQMDVVLVAVKKNVIADYVDVVEKAGLDAVVMDVDAFALGNIYELNYGDAEGKVIALVNVGASKTNISVLQEGAPIFTRDCSIGCNNHTDALVRELSLSREDAEQVKQGHTVASAPAENAQTVLATASDEIYTELYRSFDYFKNSVSDVEISRILLSGGAALMKGFPEKMAERLGIPVEVVDPFLHIKPSNKLDQAALAEIAPMAAVAAGLALRRAGDR